MGRPSVKSSEGSGYKLLLRPPPFPQLKGHIYGQPQAHQPISADKREELFAALREARVGGEFWARPWRPGTSSAQPLPRVIVRTLDGREAVQPLTELGDPPALNMAPGPSPNPIDPWSVLPHFSHLIAHGNDEWIALATILGLDVQVLSSGRFSEIDDAPAQRAAKVLNALSYPMKDPFGDGCLDPAEAIILLGDWRRVIDGNRGDGGERIAAASGMSWWKREEIRRFLWSPGAPLKMPFTTSAALKAASKEGGALAIWPSRVSSGLMAEAESAEVKLVRVEDGFVRSVGLGSNLVPPLSVIVDRQGIHFDPSAPSDLENILARAEFSAPTLERAARLRAKIVEARISKYAAGEDDTHKSAASTPNTRASKRVVLVPGQVEDDMSVLAGGGGLTSNLELLRRTRALEPDAEIWWRPHPDVDAGHRIGAVDDAAALKHADRIAREGAMSDLLDKVDALHTITSLSGFEALLRGCDVTCHGVPFYAGWGLTRDLGEVPARRGRTLSLDELVAGVLILYPRYLDPVTKLPCPPETLIKRLAEGEAVNRLGWVEPLRRAQGHLMRRLRKIGGS